MKKLATLLLAAGMVFGAATGASAIDFKAKGQWIMDFNLGDNKTFSNDVYGNSDAKGNKDNFSAQQRVRLQLDAVASEALSGTVYFEIGDQVWGQDKTGGALGADGKHVEVKNAYIDWIVPNTDLKLRMGIQGIKLPSFTNGNSQILDDDMAGIVASYKFNENVTLTALWARLYNDNTTTKFSLNKHHYVAGEKDNADLFAVLLPLTFDGVKVTPWAAYATIGAHTIEGGIAGPAADTVKNGLVSPWAGINAKDFNHRFSFWGAGLTGEITMADPFRFAWDFNYAAVDTGDDYSNRRGWYLSLLGEYKMDWGTPGLYAWYASGEDDDASNGSEQMPFLNPNGTDQYSNFASNGNIATAPNEAVLGKSWQGTWGVGVRIKDMSFLEDLKHTVRINYIGGTNDVDATFTKNFLYGDSFINNMATTESALEFGLTNSYKIYENLNFYTDLAYIVMWQDDDVRRTKNAADAWNINAAFIYSF